jgi:hypothetical protein
MLKCLFQAHQAAQIRGMAYTVSSSRFFVLVDTYHTHSLRSAC